MAPEPEPVLTAPAAYEVPESERGTYYGPDDPMRDYTYFMEHQRALEARARAEARRRRRDPSAQAQQHRHAPPPHGEPSQSEPTAERDGDEPPPPPGPRITRL
jgi:hypothetical protein